MNSLESSLVVVTGASRGIGLAIAERFRETGAHVVRLARTLTDTRSDGQTDYCCDVTDQEQVDRVVGDVLHTHAVPDVVVNNAGAFLIRSLAETAFAEFRQQMEANLLGPFLVIRAFLPHLVARGRGLIINIGSVADHRAFVGNAAYAASKFGLRGLHDVLHEEVAGTGVRCTLVSPGPTDTTLWDPLQPDRRTDVPSRAAMLRPADVAEAVLFAATRPAHVSVDWIQVMPAH